MLNKYGGKVGALLNLGSVTSRQSPMWNGAWGGLGKDLNNKF